MKFWKTLLAIIFTAGFMFLNSCDGDDPANPQPEDKTKYNTYFPMKAGTWWVYETFLLDGEQNKDESSLIFDSTAVTGTIEKLGKTATVFTTYNSEGSSEEYFYVEDSKLYTHSSYLMPVDPDKMPVDFDLDDKWVCIADFLNTSWQVHTQQVKDAEMEMEFGSFPIKAIINGTYTISGAKKGMKNISVGDETIECQEFELTYTFTGKIAITIPTYNEDNSFTLKQRLYFADKKGLIQKIFDSANITIKDLPLGIGDYIFPIQGYDSKAIYYNIAQ